MFLRVIVLLLLLSSCSGDAVINPIPPPIDNPKIPLEIPAGFPPLNHAVKQNWPTKYGVELGKALFQETRFSRNNTISCASCHQQSSAFADNNPQAIGIYDRVGLRNTPPIQNLAFMQFYNWDGNMLQLERQTLVPIITHEEMNSSIMEVISKIAHEPQYKELLLKAFGDENMTPDRIYRSIAQYEYTLISAHSKYDQVKRNEGAQFTVSEAQGYFLFNQKCASCHGTELFTDQTFRNVGFPLNPSTEEAGRARVTGLPEDDMSFRVPSLRNVEYTAPYGSFGQFATLRAVLDYMDAGVLQADNRIPLTEQEKEDIISFLKTLSDHSFVSSSGGD